MVPVIVDDEQNGVCYKCYYTMKVYNSWSSPKYVSGNNYT